MFYSNLYNAMIIHANCVLLANEPIDPAVAIDLRGQLLMMMVDMMMFATMMITMMMIDMMIIIATTMSAFNYSVVRRGSSYPFYLSFVSTLCAYLKVQLR